jgi:hypothetical protein
MNLQDETIVTLKGALDSFRKGKMGTADFMAHISAANTFHKLLNQQIQTAMLFESQKKVYNTLERKGIVDATAHLDIGGDPEVDKVKCPCHNNLITRAECLDYSGSHHDDCAGCEIGKATKDKLLPEKI